MTVASLRFAVVAVAILGFLSSGCNAAQDVTEPLTGVWAFTIHSEQGTGTPTVTFEQVGESVRGHYSSTLFGDANLRGTLNGKEITFTVSADWEGGKQALNFTGEYDGSGAMEGTYTTTFGNGAFTAVRK